MSTTDTDSPNKPRFIEINKAVHKELADLPKTIRDQFLVALEAISWGLAPTLKSSPLNKTVGAGVWELKINGSPAYRLVYTLNFTGVVVVLAARRKTTNGVDKQLVEVAASRLSSRK